MLTKARRPLLWLTMLAQFAVLMPLATTAHAQRWDNRHHYDHRYDRGRHDWRRERERERREDRKAAGVVAGVVGTAVLVGVLAAAANNSNNNNQAGNHTVHNQRRARADYCFNRYGNYDPATDTYRASDGYSYRCQ